MNPKIFAKAFQEIKKQSEIQKQKIKNKIQKQEVKQQSEKVMKSKEEEQAIENDSEDQSKGKKPLIKRISKQVKAANEKQLKKWRNDLFQKIQSANNEQSKKKLPRTIYVQNSTYQQVIKVLDKHKIYIQEIQSYKLVLSDEKKASQCYQLLKNSGITVRKPNQNVQAPPQDQKKDKIFQRIK